MRKGRPALDLMCSMMSLFWHLDIMRRSRFFSVGKELSAIRETQVQSLGGEDPLEKGIATHSSILAWRNPWTEEPGRLQSMGHKESDTNKRLALSLLCILV